MRNLVSGALYHHAHSRVSIRPTAWIDTFDRQPMELLDVGLARFLYFQFVNEIGDVIELLDAVSRFALWLLLDRTQKLIIAHQFRSLLGRTWLPCDRLFNHF